MLVTVGQATLNICPADACGAILPFGQHTCLMHHSLDSYLESRRDRTALGEALLTASLALARQSLLTR